MSEPLMRMQKKKQVAIEQTYRLVNVDKEVFEEKNILQPFS